MHGCQVQNEDMVAGRMGLLRDYLESWSPRSQWWWYTILGISSYSTQYKGRLHHQHEPPTNHWFRPGKVTMCIPFLVFVVVHCWWKRRWFLRKIPEIGIWELFSQKSRLVVHFFLGGGCIDTIYYTMCSPTWYTSWWSLSAIQDAEAILHVHPAIEEMYFITRG